GSLVTISSTSLGVPAGTADNFNPFVALGRFAGGTGNLSVLNGGKLIVEGNAVSSVANPRGTYFGVGGASDTGAGGTGTALVSGAGSEIRLTGSDAFITVGRGAGAVGTLTINNQGSVSAGDINVGRGGTGTLSMDNGTLTLSGQFSGDTVTGAVLGIG